MEKNGILGLALPGGGLSGVFMVGYLLRLALLGVWPDIIVASSADAGTATYFVSGQFKEILKIWTEELLSKKFIRIWPWPIMNIDYLIDQIFGVDSPLDFERLKKSKTKLFVSATDSESGQPAYFEVSKAADLKAWLNVIRASKAVPIPPIYGRRVPINGRRFVDGSIGAPVGRNIEKAFNEGATKVLAFKNTSGDKKSKLFLKIYALFVGSGLRKAIWNYCDNKYAIPEVSVGNSLLVVEPSCPVPLKHILDNDRERMMKTLLTGYYQALEERRVHSFLKK